MKKFNKRCLAVFFVFLMTCSMSINVAAASVKDVDEMEVLSSEVSASGKETTVVSIYNDDGSVTLEYRENGSLIREYCVFPGSGEYLKRDYTQKTVAETKVVLTDAAVKRNVEARQVLQYEYWGTMYYYNGFMDETYGIRCDIAEVLNPEGSFSIVGYYADRAAFIASVVAVFVAAPKALTALAEELLASAKVKGIVAILADGTIQALHNITVDAVVTDYWIKGRSTTDSSKTGYFDGGYTAVVDSSNAIFGRVEYSGIWTRDDWRNPTFGRLMFFEVYGIEYTPTSWT